MSKFPDNFLWGTAASAYQVEGDNFYNDWWEWEQAGNSIPSGKACDHYNRFKEDFRIARDLGHNAHRFSVEWSRVEKEDGVFDQKEWDHYREMTSELLKLGIEPIVTLNHFTLPLWLARKDGWKNPEIPDLFAAYAEKAAKELGQMASWWIPLNEPLLLARIAYKDGAWPPCEKNERSFRIAVKNMLLAHVKAYRAIKKAASNDPSIKKPVIGTAHPVAAYHPCSKHSPLDIMSANFCRSSLNHFFVKYCVKNKAIDFAGLNYYFREFVHHDRNFFKNPKGYICSQIHHYDAGKRTTVGWEIYPEGIYEIIMEFVKYKLPIFITENGLAADDDRIRRDFIHDHLSYVLKAINEKAPVIGYLHWSLLDNFEWSLGYGPKFGLVAFDPATQKRTVKDSARYLASVIKNGRP